MNFNDLPLSENVLRALDDAGYQQPTPIQEKAIPNLILGKDIIACAQTGTGKTAAFALPTIELLSKNSPKRRNAIRTLILTPTRELAIQIDESFAIYSKYTHLKHTVVFGGVSQNAQTRALNKKPEILTATPGRLLDLIGQGHIDLSNLEIFILDEADRMLDMGFIHDVKRIIKLLPEKRQTLLFSATMPDEIKQLSASILYQPVKIEVTPPSTTVDKISQTVYYTDKARKNNLLLHLLKEMGVPMSLVFTRTKHGADKVVRFLNKSGISSAAIHGNKSQNARQNALNQFKEGKIKTLIATDIAARGIDIDELTHVFNFDLPNVSESYVHRIGRTGRAGNDGIAIAFCSAAEVDDLKNIEKLIGKKINVIDDHPFPAENEPIVHKQEKQQKVKNSSGGRNRGQSKFFGNRRKKSSSKV
jgi:ATP-dependent RNA helicase RhlE